MIKTSFYTKEELELMPFKSLGKNCRISRNATFYSLEEIEIGDYVRIDDFCIISGKIKLGKFSHIAGAAKLYGAGGINIGDFSGVSSNCSIYSANDDFSGNALMSTTSGDEFCVQDVGFVHIGKHVIIGSNCVILPESKINDGVTIGALSLINGKDLKEWSIYVGTPVKFLKQRPREIVLNQEKLVLEKHYKYGNDKEV